MKYCKETPTPIATRTKLKREDRGVDVDPTLFKILPSSLMYLTSNRPDIMYVVSLIFIFMETHKGMYCQLGERIVRYSAGTKKYGILCSETQNDLLIGDINNDFAGILHDRKSTSGYYVFHFGLGVISRASKKQHIVVLSLAKFEYVSTVVSCKAIWLSIIRGDLQQKQEESTLVYYDNNSTIALSRNHAFH